MGIDDRLQEIRQKAMELDKLISDTLDSEPEVLDGVYGELIANCFIDCEWLEMCFISEEA